MKKITLILLTFGMAGVLFSALAQDTPDENTNAAPAATDQSPPPGGDNGAMPAMAPPADANVPDVVGVPSEETPPPSGPTTIMPGRSRYSARGEMQSPYMPPAITGTNNPNDVTLNFRNAPLEMVLNYLSDAANLIIVLDTRVSGNVSIKGNHLTQEEVETLLGEELNKYGYAAIRDDRKLTIVDKNDAKTREIPVRTGNDPDAIKKNAEIVTQIIPIRFVDARQLVSDLTSFVSPQATVVANEAGNSIVITDTQQNIRHLVEIIKAIDSSAQSETVIKVFPLKFASPVDVATELGNIFPSTSSGGTQSPISFGGGGRGGRGGGGGGPFGGGGNPFAALLGGGGGGNSSQQRIQKATQVTAVADSRIQAVIVTAPKDLMDEIAGMMAELDVPSTRDQNVFVFHMNNGDPQQAVQVLQSMFQTTQSRNTSQNQNSALMTRQQNNTTQTGSSTSRNSSSGAGASLQGRAGG